MMTMTLKKLIIVSTYLCIVHLVIHRFYSISMIWSSRKLKRKHISEQRKFGFLEPQKVQKLTFKWADIPPPYTIIENFQRQESLNFEKLQHSLPTAVFSVFDAASGWAKERMGERVREKERKWKELFLIFHFINTFPLSLSLSLSNKALFSISLYYVNTILFVSALQLP